MGHERRFLSPLLIFIGISLFLRLATSFFLGDTLDEIRAGTYDQYFYDTLAIRVIDGHGFTFGQFSWPFTRAGEPTAHWSYLYTLFVAGIYQLLGHHPLVARLLQSIIVGIATPLLIYRIGKRSFNEKTAVIGAAISAVYLYFVVFSASLMTEAFYIVGILWIIDVAMRVVTESTTRITALSSFNRYQLLRGIELGVAISITLLLRQVIVIFVFTLVGWLIWVAWRRQVLRMVLRSVLIAGALSVVLISPTIIRNYFAFGRLTMPNTNSGFALFWSNHPIYGTRFEPVLSAEHGVTYQELVPEEFRHLDEAALDRALLFEGLKQITADPIRYIMLSLSRIPIYFLFWPTPASSLTSNSARILSFGLFLPFMIYGLVLSIRYLLHARKKRLNGNTDDLAQISSAKVPIQVYFQLLLILFVCIYSFIHLASWANVRYRLPVDSILIIFAGYGINDLLLRLQTSRRPVTTGLAKGNDR